MLFSTFTAYAGDTNFVVNFNTMWATHNASNILAFTEAQIETNRSVETLFARGIVAALLQQWTRGAGSYLEQAIGEAQSNATYTAEGRIHVEKELGWLKNFFIAVANDSNEPTNSVPQWNPSEHTAIFDETGDGVPYIFMLEDIVNTQ
jgi:hypothetical protein